MLCMNACGVVNQLVQYPGRAFPGAEQLRHGTASASRVRLTLLLVQLLVTLLQISATCFSIHGWRRRWWEQVFVWHRTEMSGWNRGGCAAVLRDLDRMEKWANRDYIKFSKGKCTVQPYGWITLSICGWLIGWKAVLQKWTLRSWWTTKLTMNHRCAPISRETNSILGFIRNSVAVRLQEVILPPDVVLVKPRLQYFVQICVPLSVKHMDLVEPMRGHKDD